MPLIAIAWTLFLRADVAVEVHDLVLDSVLLRNNPLKDPTRRHVAVFRPAGTEKKRLPIVFYLPGFGGNSIGALADPKGWQDVVSTLHRKGLDIVLAVADGSNRYVCSQYIDSPASGPYMQYLCDEVLPLVERKENCGGKLADRIVIGHSSGGFGALRIGMARQKLFGGVVALSPDSFFDVTHKPFTLSDSVKNVPIARIQAIQPPKLGPFADIEGDFGYCLALCVDYAGNKDGTFEWLYDAKGNYVEKTYQRWRSQDPVEVARRMRVPFSRSQRIYLEGAAQDDFKADEGAAKVAEVLGTKKNITFTTYFPPGHHSDHQNERIVRGVSWVKGLPLDEIRP